MKTNKTPRPLPRTPSTNSRSPEMKGIANGRGGRAFAILAVCLLLGSGAALAQQQAGTVFGTVTDDQNSRLPGVTVTLSGAGAPIVQVTDERGQFRFPGLTPGRSEEHTSELQSQSNLVCR